MYKRCLIFLLLFIATGLFAQNNELAKQLASLQGELQSLKAEWDATPTGALFDYWLGSEARDRDAIDAAPEVEAWIKHLSDVVDVEMGVK